MRSILTATVLAAVVPVLLHPDSPSPPVVRAWPADTGRDSTKDTVSKNDSLPLTTTRSVSFDVSEGTWMSLDLSPDAATAGEEYLAALDETDAYCRANRLLTLETPPLTLAPGRFSLIHFVASMKSTA